MKKVMQIFLLMGLLVASFSALGGGWDKKKGPELTTIKGEILCLGCNLKKVNGANAQCSLYDLHALGIKTKDGLLWTIINNAVGHDLIRAHGIVDHKDITIKGYLYPLGHMIEVISYEVKGVSKKVIQKKAWEVDQQIAKALLKRKPGEAPNFEHAH